MLWEEKITLPLLPKSDLGAFKSIREVKAVVERKYETVFIISPTLDDEARANLIEKFKNLISSNGQLLTVEEWGKRRLAYKIDKHAEGYYVLMQFISKPEFPRELERVYRITDGVIRFLIVKLEK